jgi:SAM-dependent methyltransferase
MASNPPDAIYSLGRSEGETQRLLKQAQVYDPLMRQLLEDAGIGPGAKVLDVGSGAGDVAMLAARLVGPDGAVVGVDTNPVILALARERVAAAGLENVMFLAGDFRTLQLTRAFDAAIGRLVLRYQGDPATALRAAADLVRPGGVVAFDESDLTLLEADYPWAHTSPLFRLVVSWVVGALRRSGVHTDMGYRLFDTFRQAGLGEPTISVYAPLGGDADWPGYDFYADTMRSLLPALEELGVSTAEEVDVDTLADRLRAEVLSTGVPIQMPPHVTAWARM